MRTTEPGRTTLFRSRAGPLCRMVAQENDVLTAHYDRFRDAWDRYARAGVMVFGVSGDDQSSKAEFAKEEKLPFPILADPEHRWAEAFGVGSTLGMMDRVTFLLDATGAVAKVYPDVDPGVHAVEVLEDAKGLGADGGK